MKVLIIGNGGREHAIAWKVAQSDQISQVWVAPGNAGTATEEKVQNIAIAPTDVDQLVAFAKIQKIDLTIVGPEAALDAGITDRFQQEDLPIFAPSKAAAQLEISKNFSKEFMLKYNIPTAKYQSFTEVEPALKYLEQHPLPVVIKADGLAAGKGVIITEDLLEAQQTINDMLSGKSFGKAGNCVVIEEFLTGTELSYIVMVDGENVLPLASSKDHKRRDNGDKGPNTGGMGAISPSPLLSSALEQQVLNEIIYPTVAGMKAEGTPYTGFLYAGLMIDQDGQPKVLEYNCRLGDPETQALLPRLQSDLAQLCLLGTQQKLNTTTAKWVGKAAITIVMASGGYPKQYRVGDLIKGISRKLNKEAKVFQAGTKISEQGLVTNGGRVLCVTSLGETLQLAYDNAYNAVEQISWRDCYYRTDIGLLCMTQQPTSV
jgi:phosphoribosylamine--glycine ligase